MCRIGWYAINESMCGIAGIMNKGPSDEDHVRKMVEVISHRGPDGRGYWSDDHISLGVARLAVIDIPGGAQPMTSPDGRWTLVYNGEVYNHLQLREKLEKKGHTFKTRCDTEAVLGAMMEYGTEAVEHLRGIFAFAAWDSLERKLILARDRLGIKPLYYFFKNGAFAFASEIKALLEIPDIRNALEPDLKSLHEIMTFNFPLADRTAFDGIRELRPGHVAAFRDGRLNIRRYWDLNFPALGDVPENKDEREWADGLLENLKKSVELRLMSDVPLGVFLSGGPDSSIIAALVNKITGGGLKTFSVGFDEPLWDESGFARQVAEHLDTDHTVIKGEGGLELLPTVIYHLDQPQRWAGTAALLGLYRAAKENATVVLTGEGADEALAGYIHLAEFPGIVRNNPGAAPLSLYLARLSELEASGAESLYSPAFLEAARRPVNEFLIDEGRIKDCDPLNMGIYLDMKLRLARFVVFMQDKLSMAAGVEARVPYLDHELLEYCSRIPPGLKLSPPWGKYILRKAATDLLPKDIIERPKQGFVEPADAWMRGKLPEVIRNALSEEKTREKGYFRPAEVERLLTAHRSGTASHGHLLIGIASVHIWHDTFFG